MIDEINKPHDNVVKNILRNAMELKSFSFAFVKELADFSYEMSVLDRFWNILFPDQAEEWSHLYVNKYKQTFCVKNDWIKANKRVQVEYPLQYRYGIAPLTLIRASFPDVYRLDKELGKAKTRKLVHLVKTAFSSKQRIRKSRP
ncbi:MAG: hypothetical protein K9J81_09935 [Desulfohalobiaceae bacterium]|nr:hypothetical protein [Desulfohalobiaceae bacterium]